ncbi:hypothetical protein F2Q69_00023760 [Brassica cretica]|uniref:Uncharacterized protein n=1 Tax=Brassica cretica TaxID=69181 RepID=A0A8S9Q4V2_BRACR|nr:hypothetical protein F2Q69_00023760 [Brassica cretica]
MASSSSSPTLLSTLFASEELLSSLLLLVVSSVGIPETSRRMESSWGSRFSSSMNWTRSFIPANIFFNSQMLQLQLSTYCFPNRDVTVYLSLWDEATSTFSGLLKRGDKSQSVMLVVTTVNPKLFGRNLYLNSTPGDMFVLDTSLSEITKFAENGGEENLPSCLEELTEKEFVFQIRVTPFNFTPNHRIFTVPTITEDTILGTHGKIVLFYLIGSITFGPSVLGENVREECATADPP